jgi:[calcium/calmodulin-dependent protein kinase] kinase
MTKDVIIHVNTTEQSKLRRQKERSILLSVAFHSTSSSSTMPDPSDRPIHDSASRPERPTLLKPPETIISPPSPTDIKSSDSAVFPSPTRDGVTVEYDSPKSASESDEDTRQVPPPRRERRIPSPRPRGPSDSLGSLSSRPVAADAFSKSPQAAPNMLRPESPGPSSRPMSTRSPSPSSPHYRPRPLHQRRASSTHQVRETTDGETRNTESGDRMVNQYKIGRALGRGAYATVESAVDVGTGIEYVRCCASSTI